ncbi:uncharacterized protein MYCFIDRAFT_177677 [Pseudocercospora fijiensis CIRAD86]|uniref:Uncharacterized protein n=1 Tax=Pseudocercospora fijiensis (strain CIRAD86) TaxID=383855 RepID=M2ZIP7_PSEFD|nr:uncharacterized protein MYCFIDRAFT_177677 [Pseudocercospora fijiensis CIRAD86]EME78989.1 hypothetical protein MYCFIDRAFT_177677 [Pseudocercospora fijiensis CIRAD86]
MIMMPDRVQNRRASDTSEGIEGGQTVALSTRLNEIQHGFKSGTMAVFLLSKVQPRPTVSWAADRKMVYPERLLMSDTSKLFWNTADDDLGMGTKVGNCQSTKSLKQNCESEVSSSGLESSSLLTSPTSSFEHPTTRIHSANISRPEQVKRADLSDATYPCRPVRHTTAQTESEIDATIGENRQIHLETTFTITCECLQPSSPRKNHSNQAHEPDKTMEPQSRMKRAVDGATSTRIRYQSPPFRSEEDATLYLAEIRHPGPRKPRHTHPDTTAAQDLALDKAAVLVDCSKRAHVSRRDSAVVKVKDQDDDSSLTDLDSTPEDAGGEVKPSAGTIARHGRIFTTKLTIRSPITKRVDKFESSDGPTLLTPTSTQLSFSNFPANSQDEKPKATAGLSENASVSRGRSPKRSLEDVEAPDDLRPPPKASKSIPRASSKARRKSPAKAPKRKPVQEGQSAHPPASRAVAPPVLSTEPASPPKQVRTNVKGILNKEDLTIAGTSKLDPTAPIDYVKEYKYKGRWYEVIGEDRPSWAEDERTVTRSGPVQTSRRSTGAWRRSKLSFTRRTYKDDTIQERYKEFLAEYTEAPTGSDLRGSLAAMFHRVQTMNKGEMEELEAF